MLSFLYWINKHNFWGKGSYYYRLLYDLFSLLLSIMFKFTQKHTIIQPKHFPWCLLNLILLSSVFELFLANLLSLFSCTALCIHFDLVGWSTLLRGAVNGGKHKGGAWFSWSASRPILHFRHVFVCVDDFPCRSVGLMATPITAWAAQIAKAEMRKQAENKRL